MPDFYFILFLKRLDADEKLHAACTYNLFDILCNHLMFYYVYMPLRGPFNLNVGIFYNTMKGGTAMKVLFFFGINFRGFVKNYKFVDS
jgi:hypothetical protein